MTTGSWNRDAFITDPPSGAWVGRKHSKTWDGGDRAKLLATSPPSYREIVRNGVSLRVPLKRTGISRPPKRAYDEEHAYNSLETLMLDEYVTYQTGEPWVGNPPITRPVMWAFGAPQWAAATLLTSNDILKMLGKLREKIAGSDFNMSVFLGEGHQTLRMIGDTAIKIAKSLHHLRKGDLAGTARSLLEGTTRAPHKPYKEMKPFKATSERMSSHWLELQYGWLPLVKDAEAGAEFLAHKLSVPAQQTYRMSVRRELRSSVTTNLNPGVNVIGRSTRTQTKFVKLIVSENPSLMASLGLTRPELVAWELMPFSFVADWFIPIGSYLEARAIVSTVVGKWVVSDKYVGVRHPITETGGAFAPKSSAYFRQSHIIRTVTAAPDIPMPEFKPLSKVASWQHCANAVALLTQFATGGKARDGISR
jgi:hypothetical protein